MLIRFPCEPGSSRNLLRSSLWSRAIFCRPVPRRGSALRDNRPSTCKSEMSCEWKSKALDTSKTESCPSHDESTPEVPHRLSDAFAPPIEIASHPCPSEHEQSLRSKRLNPRLESCRVHR